MLLGSFQDRSQTRGNLDGFQTMIHSRAAADAGHLAMRHRLAVFAKFKRIGHRLAAQAFEMHRDVQKVFEVSWAFKIAGSRHARKTDRLAFPGEFDAQTARAQEFDLRRLHVTEEVREVHYARHVGVGELYAACGAKNLRHRLRSAWGDICGTLRRFPSP